MPAKSKAQQATFGMALAVRRGKLPRSKASKAVLHIVNSKISNKAIRDYASTKHEDLPGKIGESLNEGKKIWHDYIQDGMYYVGEHGLGCDPNITEIEKAADDEEYEHTWSVDIPEGSTVKINRFKVIDGYFGEIQVLKIKVIELGTGSVPFNTYKATKGKTYYSSEDSAFGSGNIVFQEQVVEEGIKKYQTKISSEQYAEIRDKPNKAKDWEWSPEEQLYIRKVIVLPIVTLKNDPSMDIHAGDYKVINKKEHNGGMAYELRSVSNPGLVITLPATYVDSKGIKKESVDKESNKLISLLEKATGKKVNLKESGFDKKYSFEELQKMVNIVVSRAYNKDNVVNDTIKKLQDITFLNDEGFIEPILFDKNYKTTDGKTLDDLSKWANVAPEK